MQTSRSKAMVLDLRIQRSPSTPQHWAAAPLRTWLRLHGKNLRSAQDVVLRLRGKNRRSAQDVAFETIHKEGRQSPIKVSSCKSCKPKQ